MKNPWNERAGTNRHSRDVRGEHKTNPGYRPGDNWIVCQRCGFDIMASDGREDGYREGLIVCPKCYDAPHPQDFVRALEDTLIPQGFSTGASEYSRVCAVGSTEVPFATMRGEQNPTLGTVPDQTYESDEAITTIETGATDFGSYADYRCSDDTIGPATYCVDQLPEGIVIEATTGDITGTIVEDPASEDGMQSIVCAIYADGITYSLPAFTWNLTTNLELAPNEMEYIPCSPEAANASNLQVWYDANDTSSQFLGAEWTGALADEAGDDIGSVLNKAYPVATFPTRGTTTTCDLRALATEEPKVTGHDTAPSTNDFTGTATAAWGFWDTTGHRSTLESMPLLTVMDLMKPCTTKTTRIWVLETPESGHSSNQMAVDTQGTPGGAWLHYHTADDTFYWEYFNPGSNQEVVSFGNPRAATPKWEIFMVRMDEDNAVEEANFWRNGTHLATHVSAFDPFTLGYSLWFGSRYPTPFPTNIWESKWGEFIHYDRWLSNDEMNALLLHLSLKHGVTIEATIGFEGSES